MQGLVLVDKDGVPVHRAFSYMDQRAKKQIKEGIANGIQIAGANIFKLLLADDYGCGFRKRKGPRMEI